jgi:hypothetical protein
MEGRPACRHSVITFRKGRSGRLQESNACCFSILCLLANIARQRQSQSGARVFLWEMEERQ